MLDLIKELESKHMYLTLAGDDLELSCDHEIDHDMLIKIRENKPQLIELLKKYQKRNAYKGIIPIEEAVNYPLSDAQKRLWMLCQFEDGSVAYNIPFRLNLKDIDIIKFRRAVDAVITRHEILRTIFKEDHTGEIRQWILSLEQLKFHLNYFDVRADKNRDTFVSDYIYRDFFKPFDLEKGPLLRGSLFQTSDHDYIFSFNLHHIIGDDWSVKVLMHDTIAYYEAEITGNEAKLTELTIQYKDYAAWLSHKQQETDKDYWAKFFKNKISPVVLPFEKRRPGAYSYRGNVLAFNFGNEIKDDLLELSKDQDGSLYMTLICLLKILLYKYTGEKKVMLGASFSTRVEKELENQIGIYLNNLPLIAEIEDNLSFDNFYTEIRTMVHYVLGHRFDSLEDIIDKIDYKYDKSRPGLFNVLIEFFSDNDKQVTRNITDTNEPGAIYYYEEDVPNRFDLEFNFLEKTDGLYCTINFNRDLFDYININLLRERMIELASQLTSTLKVTREYKIRDFQFSAAEKKVELLNASLQENF